MLANHDLVAFIPTTDLARARAFYGDALGLTLEDENPYACAFRANGTRLRVTLVQELAPQPFTVLGWSVPDIVATIQALPVPTERYPGMDQDAQGIWTTPGGDRVAWFKDPDGNTLSVAQFSGASPIDVEDMIE